MYGHVHHGDWLREESGEVFSVTNFVSVVGTSDGERDADEDDEGDESYSPRCSLAVHLPRDVDVPWYGRAP